MVIKLQTKKQSTTLSAPSTNNNNRFTLQQLEDLYKEALKSWKNYYEKNETKFWHNNFDIYDWIVYPCIVKGEDKFYRCVLHDQITVDAGAGKQLTFFCKNIHFSELLSHCIFHKPDEHKQYIIEKLKLK